MFRYRVIENQTKTGDKVYGVCAYAVKGQAKEKIVSIDDAFFSREKAENLVNLCNTLELDVIHFYDVVEDSVG